MEGKGTFIMLLLIIVVLSVALTVLVGFIFFSGDSGSESAAADQNEEISVPKDSEVKELVFFDDDTLFNLKADEQKDKPILQINLSLVYYVDVKGIKNVEEKIKRHENKVKEILTLYFQNLSYSEAVQQEAMKKAKEDLKEKINNQLTMNEKYKQDIVYEVVFGKWVYH